MEQFNHDYSSNISFVYDIKAGKFTYVSPSLETLLQTDFQLQSVIKDIHREDLGQLTKHLEEFLNGGHIGSVHFRILVKGIEMCLRLTPLLFQSGDSSLILANISDVTSETQNNQTIQKYANKKNSILNMLSHDLRGPLSVAQNLSQALEEIAVEKKLAGPAKNISSILKKSIDLITDLTNREFRETVESQLIKKNINIALKTDEYLEECRRSQELANRTLTYNASGPEIYIELDEAKFMQVYNNLLSNALKFTHEGGRISFVIEERNDSVLFNCSDDGIGIPEEYIPIIFDEFTEAKRTGLKGEPTLGLGLFIVKTIIDWHGGKIWVESKENTGTTFYIEIPKTRYSSHA